MHAVADNLERAITSVVDADQYIDYEPGDERMTERERERERFAHSRITQTSVCIGRCKFRGVDLT